MRPHRVFPMLTRLLAASLTISGLIASEFRGTIRTNGLPLAGATINATQAGKTITTTSDERGAFSFADLPDGAWTVEVTMLGFAKLQREITVAADAAPSAWDLKFLTESELIASIDGP